MNFSLHLQTILTFIRQINFKGKNNPYTYVRTILDVCYGLELNNCRLYWLKGILGTQSMHIYIYTYIQGLGVVKCCKHMLVASSHGYDLSWMEDEVPIFPLL